MEYLTPDPAKKILIGPRQMIYFAAFMAILLIWLLLRVYAFWLPHWKGDQGHYISLAMKLNRLGLDGYNLREVDINFARFSEMSDVGFIFPTLADKGKDGDLLSVLKYVGEDYYDEPLHMRAPLFPYAIMFSHNLFLARGQPFIVCNDNLGEKVLKYRPERILRTQFWAAIIPVFFNFLVAILTFLMGVKFLNTRVAFYAVFLMVTNPVSIMTSYRLLSEDMCAFFVTLSCLIFLWAHPKKNLIGLALAGASVGLAILTKQTAGILLLTVWVYTFLRSEDKHKGFRGFLKSVFNKEFLIYMAFAFIISGFWFLKVIQVYGDPLHTPAQGMALSAQQEDISGWFKVVNRRLTPMLFFSVGVFIIFPLFSLILFTLQRLRRQWNRVWFDAKSEADLLFFWLWILVFYLTATQPWRFLTVAYNQEHRYLYLAYPAIALLSAFVLDRFRQAIEPYSHWRWAAEAIVVLLLIGNAQIGISHVMGVIFSNNMLL